ncbi:glycerol-3-phosphate phosphatase isoform X1 [Hydra vulgaris]|uniref:Phosphoglycolate phosphatase n=2 Tax=Hydra vulgaris TaxID=6087 RepID=T2MJG3_HYDVU|nr:glycerol-3-phosphate phosphatase-like isoform X1 [Hydra vulgaris]XP_047136119.1 glycerol-3-phosphate phosphatase-like isoform X1 [Hydra vulgaris]
MGRLLKKDIGKLLNSVATIFFDCDGVLWNSHGIIQGAVETIQKLKEMNKNLLFITNNSSYSRKVILNKFQQYGFNVKLEEILSSAYIAAVYAKDIVQAEKVFVIGSTGMKEELEDVGMKYVSFENEENQVYIAKNFMESFTKENGIGAVIVAYDPKFSLHHIAAAMQYLSDPCIPYIATNTDNTFPIGNGKIGPGTGCIVNAVSTATERQPIIVGKPNRLMFDTALKRYSINSKTSLMIGDRLNTDIVFGNDCGMQTLCVLTGVTSEKEIIELSSNSSSLNLLPTCYTDKLSDLLEMED